MILDLLERFDYNKETGSLVYKNGKVAGTINSAGYLVVTINKKLYLIHRLVYLLHHPNFDQTLTIDHLDGNPLNNRIENLEAKTHKNNLRNQRLRKTNKSGKMGVRKHDETRWIAEIRPNGKTTYLGLFNTFEEAAVARDEAEKFYGFHANHGSAH